MVSPPTVERPIDRALSLIAAGDSDGALRYAVPLLERDTGSSLALFVLGDALAARGDKAAAGRAFSIAATAAVDGSNLPLAVAAGTQLRALGEDAGPIFDSIAAAFARGSSRLVERRAGPPDLPGSEPGFQPVPDSVDDAELTARAVAALGRAEERAVGADAGSAPVMRQPLFSSLTREGLREMVAIFEAQVLPSGARLLEEGSVGDVAFIVARGEVDVEKRSTTENPAPVKLARLGAGALVGEMALLSRAPRVATVTTVRPTIVLLAHKEALDHAAARAPQVGEQFAAHCKRRMLDNLVRTSALFRAATPAERPALVERFALRTFEPGEALAKQGERSGGMHLIASGEVSVQHREGAERTLVAKLGAGDVVGEVALILRRPAIADAVATHPTITLFLPESRILDLVRDMPKVFADLYAVAVHRDLETESIAKEEATETEDFVIV